MLDVDRLALLGVLGAAALGCGDNLKASGPDGGAGSMADAGVSAGCPAELDPEQLDQGAWDPRFTIAGFAGHDGLAPIVYDLDRDVDGSLVAAGTFQWLGDERVEPLLRLTEAGWEPARETWEIDPPAAGFAAVAIAGDGALALATYDDFFDGRQSEIWLDDGGGLRVIASFEGLVRSLEWYGGRLWAAGVFQMTAGDTVIPHLAVWDGTQWSAPPGGPADGFVYELALDGDRLLAGGSFSRIGGRPARMVASFDGAAWQDLGFDIDPAVAVYAVARGDDGVLYAGGSMGAIESGHGALARQVGGGWSLVGGGLAQSNLSGLVTDLLALDGSIYVSGCFNSAGGFASEEGAVPALSLARWEGERWHSLDDGTRPVRGPWFQPFVCGDEAPFALWDATHQVLTADGARVLVGGSFAGADGVLSQSILAGQGDEWIAQGTSQLGLGGWTDRVEVGGPDCALHAFGGFSHAGGERVSASVLRFEGDGWAVEAEPVPPDLYCPAFAVNREGEPLLGCAGPPPAGGGGGGALLRARGGAWERVAAADALGPINGMTFAPDGPLWLVGSGAGGAGGYAARLDGDELAVVGDGFDQPVYLIDASGADVLVTGDFTRAGDVPARRIARWDGQAWSALGAGLGAFATALGRDGDQVYVSTLESGSGEGMLLGRWDGEAWTELATPAAGLTPQDYFSFNAIRPAGGVLIAAGSVQLDGGGERGAVLWDGARFRGLAGGVRGISISGVAAGGSALWFAGLIAEAGSGDRLVPSVGVARLVLPAAGSR
jgi:hypothetical protein